MLNSTSDKGEVDMREPKILIVLVVTAALLFSVSAAAQVIVLTRAIVVDGTGAGPQKDVTIVMENGRIRDLGPSSKTPVPAGATVLDLSGKFIARPRGSENRAPVAPVCALRRDHRDEHADRSG